jgi:serine/threonine protein kinase
MEYFPPETLKSRGSYEQYDVIEQIGEGTYGKVFKAIQKATRTQVALKVIPISTSLDDGVTFTAIREIKNLLQLAPCKNVVNMLDSFFSKDNELVVVLEYFEYDLSGLLSVSGTGFGLPQIKYFMRQVLEALHQCHSSGLMHRDMKAANLLVNKTGEVKLADMGLMTTFDMKAMHSSNVVTLWYRSPELLLGFESYGPAVDLWSAGCIFLELFTKKSPFPGQNELHQLELICRICGTPAEENFPGISRAPGYKQLAQFQFPRQLRSIYRQLPPDALDLLERLLCLDPRRRIRAQEALRHPFFLNAPAPAAPSRVCLYDSLHEFEVKKRRRQELERADPAKRARQEVSPPNTNAANGSSSLSTFLRSSSPANLNGTNGARLSPTNTSPDRSPGSGSGREEGELRNSPPKPAVSSRPAASKSPAAAFVSRPPLKSTSPAARSPAPLSRSPAPSHRNLLSQSAPGPFADSSSVPAPQRASSAPSASMPPPPPIAFPAVDPFAFAAENQNQASAAPSSSAFLLPQSAKRAASYVNPYVQPAKRRPPAVLDTAAAAAI